MRGPTSAATCWGSMLRSESRTSAKTGVAPVWTMTFVGPRDRRRDHLVSRSTRRERRATGALRQFPRRRRRRARRRRIPRSAAPARPLGPVVNQPERSVSTRDLVLPEGGRLEAEEGAPRRSRRGAGLNNAEAYASSGAPSTGQRLPPARRQPARRAGAVGSMAQLPDLLLPGRRYTLRRRRRRSSRPARRRPPLSRSPRGQRGNAQAPPASRPSRAK